MPPPARSTDDAAAQPTLILKRAGWNDGRQSDIAGRRLRQRANPMTMPMARGWLAVLSCGLAEIEVETRLAAVSSRPAATGSGPVLQARVHVARADPDQVLV